MSMALRVNDVLYGLFSGVGIRLVDFKMEFGRLYQGDEVRTVLADEISPDSCRLWDMFYGQDRLEMVERALQQPYVGSRAATAAE